MKQRKPLDIKPRPRFRGAVASALRSLVDGTTLRSDAHAVEVLVREALEARGVVKPEGNYGASVTVINERSHAR